MRGGAAARHENDVLNGDDKEDPRPSARRPDTSTRREPFPAIAFLLPCYSPRARRVLLAKGEVWIMSTVTDALADALRPWDSSVRLANFVDVPTDARTFYPPETFDRLQEVKRRYDPDNLFHANHPIPSPVAMG